MVAWYSCVLRPGTSGKCLLISCESLRICFRRCLVGLVGGSVWWRLLFGYFWLFVLVVVWFTLWACWFGLDLLCLVALFLCVDAPCVCLVYCFLFCLLIFGLVIV